MEALIDALLDWIAANSEYRFTDDIRPVIVEMSPEDLTLEYYSGAPHLLPDDGVDDRLNALFSHEDGPYGTIFILGAEHVEDHEHFDDPTENPLFREILLHELVHFGQWQSGEAETWDCASFGEREAYILGGRYLKQMRATDPLPNRMFWAHVYARC